MPSRNIRREYAPHSYYHVYNRGVAKQPIFLDASDKKQFLKIIARHLDPANTSTKADGTLYRKFHQGLELLCYCLTGNHFHLLVYMGDDESSLKSFMQSVLTAYTMYFNKKYRRVGTLFQGVFRASRISNDAYLVHISRYIHLNPRRYQTYSYSSLSYYMGQEQPAWLNPAKVLALFEGEDYLAFLEDYEDQQAILEEIKHELAGQ
jgi:REP element-mobilizing transposase RayT